MDMRKRLWIRWLSGFIALVLGFSNYFIASTPVSASNNYTNKEQAFVDETAKDFEFLFKGASKFVNGMYVDIDNKEFGKRVGCQNAEKAVAFIQFVNQNNIEVAPNESSRHSISIPSHLSNILYKSGYNDIELNNYFDCMKNEFARAYSSIIKAFFTGAILNYIKNRQYKKTAKLLVKAAARAGLRLSVAVLIVEMGWFATKCAFKR